VGTTSEDTQDYSHRPRRPSTQIIPRHLQADNTPNWRDVSANANSDIRHFFEECFSELGGSSFPEWPGEQILDALTTRAADLFIWAETVVRFVEQGFLGERLKLVLAGELGGSDNLTRLYRQILELSFQGIRGPELKLSKFVIAAIVLAKVPLHYDNLYDFVSQPKLSVRFVLSSDLIRRHGQLHPDRSSFIQRVPVRPQTVPDAVLYRPGKVESEPCNGVLPADEGQAEI
jgi:hypothetical protein